jgi:hypothetical protein
MMKTKQAVPALLASLAAMNIAFAGEQDVKPNRCKGPTLCHHNPMNDGSGFFLDIGFLYEQARITGTEYAHTSPTATPWDPPLVGGDILRPSFGLEWGLILGAGYLFEHDNWVGTLNFNYLNTTANDCNACSCDDNPYYVPDCIWCHDLLDQANNVDPAYTPDFPSVSLSVNYYMLEAELGRGSYFSQYMSFEPSFGLKSVWLEFNEAACYKNVVGHYNCCSPNPGNVPPNAPVKVDALNYAQFWGIGPQVSFDTTWTISTGDDSCCDSTYSLFADFDAALLIGRTKSYTDVKVAGVDTIRLHNEYSMMSPTLRIVLGLSSERAFYNNQQHVRARIGWDNVVYFNQFTKTCYGGICSLNSNENNTFSLTGLLFDVAWSF